MNSFNWEHVIDDLPFQSNHAGHALCDGPTGAKLYGLREALKVVPIEKIIINTIEGYRDWSGQPYCDQIIRFFGTASIPHLLIGCDHTLSTVRLGSLDMLFEIDPFQGASKANQMQKNETAQDVKALIGFVLDPTSSKTEHDTQPNP